MLVFTATALLQASDEGPAHTIASKLKFKKGIAIDAGCGDAKISVSLMKSTEFYFYCVESGEIELQTARATISAAGVYGTKASTTLSSLDQLHYPDNCANLVICGDEFVHGL